VVRKPERAVSLTRDSWTIDKGLLTPTVKRAVIEAQFDERSACYIAAMSLQADQRLA
jgi:hypothetical protein